MTSEVGNTDKVFGFIQDWNPQDGEPDFTIEIKNPDINKSNYRFFVPKPKPNTKQHIQFDWLLSKDSEKQPFKSS